MVECCVCEKPSSVLIRCSRCEKSHCQSCVDAPAHVCNQIATRKKSDLVADGYQPLGRDTLVPVERKTCACGEYFEGQFATTEEAADALGAWTELHVGRGHELKGGES